MVVPIPLPCCLGVGTCTDAWVVGDLQSQTKFMLEMGSIRTHTRVQSICGAPFGIALFSVRQNHTGWSVCGVPLELT